MSTIWYSMQWLMHIHVVWWIYDLSKIFTYLPLVWWSLRTYGFYFRAYWSSHCQWTLISISRLWLQMKFRLKFNIYEETFFDSLFSRLPCIFWHNSFILFWNIIDGCTIQKSCWSIFSTYGALHVKSTTPVVPIICCTISHTKSNFFKDLWCTISMSTRSGQNIQIVPCLCENPRSGQTSLNSIDRERLNYIASCDTLWWPIIWINNTWNSTSIISSTIMLRTITSMTVQLLQR